MILSVASKGIVVLSYEMNTNSLSCPLRTDSARKKVNYHEETVWLAPTLPEQSKIRQDCHFELPHKQEFLEIEEQPKLQ